MLRTVYGIRKRYGDGLALLCEDRGDAEAVAEAMFAYSSDDDEAADYVREVRMLVQHPAASRELRAFVSGLLDGDWGGDGGEDRDDGGDDAGDGDADGDE